MNNMDVNTFGELLTVLRKQHRISQNELADKLDVHRNTIGKWERGTCLPESKTIVLELAKQLRLNENETRQLLEASLTVVSSYWNVPYQRNPFFTGREEILQYLHTLLCSEKTAAITQSHALSGLGGIGKTQTALEYAYRHSPEYAAVFWIGADTYETLTSSFISIAEVLNLPERKEQDQSKIVAAVIRWLNSHQDWLLICDNVEDIEMVKRFLPTSRGGAILLTTRIHALGALAHTIELAQMTREEGILLLSRRAKLHDHYTSQNVLSPADAAIARTVVELMDGLPLALDQAGSYIEATQCSLSDYQRLFQSSRLRLLDERDAYADHSLSVTRTFTLAFERLQQSNPAAAELLTVCAFLAPEAIPETFFIEGAAHLGPTFESLAADPLQFNVAIKALLTYSLLQRNAAMQTVTIHRLVQAVLKESLDDAIQGEWIVRIIRAMIHTFPLNEEVQVDYSHVGDRLLSHALVCITFNGLRREDEVQRVTLMIYIARYLTSRAYYSKAEPIYQQALNIAEYTLGAENPLVAEALYGLADLDRVQGKYELAEPPFLKAIRIGEEMLGPEHPQVATSLNSLGHLYWNQGKFAEAESLFQKAIQIREKALGPEHPQVATSFNSLGLLYLNQGKFAEAESLFQKAIQIREKILGPEHSLLATSLTNLGTLYLQQGKYELAETLYQRALRIREGVLDPKHPQMGYPLTNLGSLYHEQGKYELAEPLYQRALRIYEEALGPKHRLVAHLLSNLAELMVSKIGMSWQDLYISERYEFGKRH